MPREHLAEKLGDGRLATTHEADEEDMVSPLGKPATGSSLAPVFLLKALIKGPAITIVSLLAKAKSIPFSRTIFEGRRPAAPAIPFTTISGFDSSINFSDCTILSTMIRNKIDKIISFDSDFEKVKGIKIIN